jgi:hypothetical protein
MQADWNGETARASAHLVELPVVQSRLEVSSAIA